MVCLRFNSLRNYWDKWSNLAELGLLAMSVGSRNWPSLYSRKCRVGGGIFSYLIDVRWCYGIEWGQRPSLNHFHRWATFLGWGSQWTNFACAGTPYGNHSFIGSRSHLNWTGTGFAYCVVESDMKRSGDGFWLHLIFQTRNDQANGLPSGSITDVVLGWGL